MGEKCCCCHIVTSAAVVGMVQLLTIVTIMSLAGTTLSRWETWYDWWEDGELEDDARQWRNDMVEEMRQVKVAGRTLPPMDWTAKKNTTWVDSAENWHGVVMELQLAVQLGVCAVWLVALLAYAAAFRYWKPVFVLPNLILQIFLLVSAFFGILNFVVRLASEGGEGDATLVDRPVDKAMDKEGLSDEDEKAMAAVGLVFSIIFFVVELIVTIVIQKFYKHLRMLAGLVFPGLPPAAAVPDKVGDYENMA